MNSQEYHSLQEAYMNVYQEVDEAVYGGTPMRGDKRYRAADHMDEATAMAKRGLNEPAIRQQIASKTGASGAGKFADKATALADKPTFGQRGVNPQARKELARIQRKDFRKTTSSNPGLHGYGHQSSDPAVKAKQKARGAQRSALTPNEREQLNMSYDLYDVILAHLLAEGYADTNENALVIMANMSEEWRQSIMEGKSDRPLGYMHPFARGMKQPRGEKRDEKYGQDTEGNITGKYANMQKSKRST